MRMGTFTSSCCSIAHANFFYSPLFLQRAYGDQRAYAAQLRRQNGQGVQAVLHQIRLEYLLWSTYGVYSDPVGGGSVV